MSRIMVSLNEYALHPHDVPIEEPPEQPTFICDYCGDDVPEYDKVKGVSCLLCPDCIGKYCEDMSDKTDAISDFLAEHEEEFYLEFYFENLSTDEKLLAVKEIYKQRCADVQGNKDKHFKNMEKDFCLDDDNFFNFLRKR